MHYQGKISREILPSLNPIERTDTDMTISCV